VLERGGWRFAADATETMVYRSLAADGTVQYVGITSNFEARAAAHLGEKGIEIDAIPGLLNLTRADARAVEQVLIEFHGLAGNGTLLNKINSISPNNPIYNAAVARGTALLRDIGYAGF
jgi:filamentous hemagglutinin